PRPAIEHQCGGEAGNQAAAGRCQRYEHTVRARGADVPALRVDRELGAHVGREVTELVHVERDIDCADLLEPHRAVGVDQAGVDVPAGHVDALGVRRHGYVRAHGGDHAVLEDNGAVLDYAVG